MEGCKHRSYTSEMTRPFPDSSGYLKVGRCENCGKVGKLSGIDGSNEAFMIDFSITKDFARALEAHVLEIQIGSNLKVNWWYVVLVPILGAYFIISLAVQIKEFIG